MTDSLTPCSLDNCLGYVCAFHSLPPEAQDDLTRLRQRLEEAEKVRSAAQAFVDAPTKFNIRHRAYLYLVKMLDEAYKEDR